MMGCRFDTNIHTKFKMSLRALFVSIAVSAVTGCAIPAAVDPLPYFKEDASGSAVETPRLCILYHRYGFLEGDTGTCSSTGWKLKELSEADLMSAKYRSRRNELQHTILTRATNLCADYRQDLTEQAESFAVGPAALALFLTAGSAAATSAKEFAAGAAAVGGIGALTKETYTNDLENALLGIELARTRIFKQILENQGRNLLDYPVSRAINDAKRYHGVCNRMDGRTQVSRALSDSLQAQ